MKIAIKSILWAAIQAILPGLILLCLEYWTGLFQAIPADAASEGSPSGTRIALLSALMVILSWHFIRHSAASLSIIFRHKHTIREFYSFHAGSAIVSLCLISLVSFFASTTPWAQLICIIDYFRTNSLSISLPTWSESAVLFLSSLLLIIAASSYHARWPGAISIVQKRAEDSNQSNSFLREYVDEMVRRIQGIRPSARYEPAEDKYISSIGFANDTVDWKHDLALELVSLAYRSYDFSNEKCWHANQKCWVGSNVATGDLVIVYPEYSTSFPLEIVTYANRLADLNAKRIDSLIIVSMEDQAITMPELISFPTIVVTILTIEALYEQLVDFREYRRDIAKRIKSPALTDLQQSIESVYTNPRFYYEEQSGSLGRLSVHDLNDFIDQWLNEAGLRQIALLGDYGQGKSTAALALTHRLLSQKGTRIPILIELRGLSPRNLSPDELLATWGARYRIDSRALMHLHASGRLLLIFDGFDEMALVGDSEMRLRHFRVLWSLCYKHSKLIFTGRPNFFVDTAERIAALGSANSNMDRPWCTMIRIAPFSFDQIRTALRNCADEVRERICKAAEVNPRFYDLVSRPSLLHMVASLAQNNENLTVVENLTAADVMAAYVQASYRRQGLKENDSRDFMALTTPERAFFMEGIAAYMISHELPNQISSKQLNEVIENLCEAMPEEMIEMQSHANSEETLTPLKVRIKNSTYGIEHVKTDVRACGLLVDDPSRINSFKFGHKSFLEFLAASILYKETENGLNSHLAAIKKATSFSIAKIQYVMGAIDFFAELLTSHYVARLESGTLEKIDLADENYAAYLLRSLSGAEGEFQWFRTRLAMRAMYEAAVDWNRVTADREPGSARLITGRMLFRAFLAEVMKPSSLVLFGLASTFGAGAMSYVIKNKTTGKAVANGIIIIISLMAILPAAFSISLQLADRARLRCILYIWAEMARRLGISESTMHRALGATRKSMLEEPFPFGTKPMHTSKVIHPPDDVSALIRATDLPSDEVPRTPM